MAPDRQNKEFLSPPNSEFLTEDTFAMNNQQNWSSFFGSYDSMSELNSPVDSELGSTETDSSEEGDDYMAQLTRHMTHSMFQEDHDSFNKQSKTWGFACEPSPINANFEKMKINDNERFFTTPIGSANQNHEFQSNQTLVDYQIKATQFYRLKQEQIMKQQQSLYNKNKLNVSPQLESVQRLSNFNEKRSIENNNRLINTQKGQWHAPNRQSRAVFLNGSCSGTRSSGTGVFLPRRVGNSSGVGNPNESRKKTGCSTVLIPARVLQALKLHYEKLETTSRSDSSGFTNRHDRFEGGRNNAYPQQEQQSRTVPTWNHQETGLPQEWTY